METNWVKIKGYDKVYLAEIAKEVLFDNGIDAVIMNKQDGSYMTFGEVEVYVNKDNEAKAKDCLKELD